MSGVVPAASGNAGRARAGVRLERVELFDMRAIERAALEPAAEGTTVITGPNGSGKTTILEAVAYLGTQRSFRTSQREAMVRVGSEAAIVRGTLTDEGRPVVVESEIRADGPARTLLNRQRPRSRSDLAAAVPVTVFSPDDPAIVRGAPARRREVLDEALRIVDHKVGALLDEMERVLRQRAALLRQAGGRLTADVSSSLDVWDERLARAGEVIARARAQLVEELCPDVASAYAAFAGGPATVSIAYRRSWHGDLREELAAHRADDVRRGVTTVGPQRDDVDLVLDGRDTRVQVSQGEQRSMALALRLAVHRLVTAHTGAAPILLLDDVFSELDAARSRALLHHLPAGQALLTTAMALPDDVEVARVVDVQTLRAAS